MSQKLDMTVVGMTCTGCEQRIGKALGRLDGVRQTDADHATGHVEVVFDPEAVTVELISERLATAGYEVTAQEATR
ncbi:MAG: heavy-metal-associated domain-containing protein [Actinomycetota bacterium]|jgi:copper chaperone CopZ|nr:heavy-metal-associated domain-containing protein [Euzebyales bacterium]MDQ3451556.1 heavy-metal-associated domain-containing protein [Actinomycetota bacterium]